MTVMLTCFAIVLVIAIVAAAWFVGGDWPDSEE